MQTIGAIFKAGRRRGSIASGISRGACIALALGVAVVPAACGSDETPGAGTGAGAETGAPSDLALLVPEGPFGVTEVDLAALREALGLPPDADPSEPGEGAHDRFVEASHLVVPFCYVGPSQPLDEAIREAIDCSAIRAAAAAAGVGVWNMSVLRTTQPFEEIAGSLTGAGYQREGNLLVHPGEGEPVRYREVIAAPDDPGLIVLAREPTEGFAALRERGPAEPEDRPELALLGSLPDAPVRSARVPAEGDVEACMRAWGLADLIAEPRGELVVEVDGDAEAERFRLGEVEGFIDGPAARELFDFDPPEADGSTLRVPFGLLGTGREMGAILAHEELSFAHPYECGPATEEE